MIHFRFKSFFLVHPDEEVKRRFTSVKIFKDTELIAEGKAVQSKSDTDVQVVGQEYAVKDAIRNNVPREQKELRKDIWDAFYTSYSKAASILGAGYLQSNYFEV